MTTEKAPRRWTPDEDVMLRESYRFGWMAVSRRLPHRDRASIQSRACLLELTLPGRASVGFDFPKMRAEPWPSIT